MKIKLAKLIYRFVYWAGIYLWWSKRYRKRWPLAKQSPLPGVNSPEAVMKKLKALKWTRDGARELWDAINSPQWVQFCVNTIKAGFEQPKGALDCDEFAVYSAAVLPQTMKPVVLNVFWWSYERGPLGHNVCLYKNDAYYYIGNWGNIGPFPTVPAVILDVVRRANDENTLVGWARFTPDLELQDYGTTVEESL